MADRPILFSAPMVLALLADTKTQTRRVMKPQPFESGYFDGDVELTVIPANDQWPKAFRFNAEAVGGDAILGEIFEPRISEGDRLWVRETLKADSNDQAARWITYGADGAVTPHGLVRWDWKRDSIPSIHMPRWASRLTLTVTDVRVERLQDISEADAQAEGAVPYYCAASKLDTYGPSHAMCGCDHRAGFCLIWEKINGIESWDANPWVTVYAFSVEKQNIDLIERAA
ncbi:hypothetical protein BMW22_15930 [Rhizobium leguminosarum]|uniref:Uncharacterized protein n=1 Tax=Rhizobium leguminosarum TaxID=384 RepID=A0A1L3ZBG7_RHILE|nr:hypothetical protein [Rhizobium leguminosarum]API52911.1 hypothetical protein BMW22_15930 [Rhizobium leguminosarum]